jgi:hypothetical protein
VKIYKEYFKKYKGGIMSTNKKITISLIISLIGIFIIILSSIIRKEFEITLMFIGSTLISLSVGYNIGVISK